ncbi:hypothetical protein OIU34_24945 [Pararhizobium sp. BT-229]|uniref:hypothetical protein n=1 Tax=Pararhizobium sp. BT-229 TaxID=2986923 RepID=UPI0021F7A37E|nr:hypothetical protein [Pararhizobium sp. BT-229]MCV9965130.1 hypothetical protein [Pararhizobium sp. BT-229]
MKIKAAAVLLLALSSTSSLAFAADGIKGFTYRYTKTYFVDQGGPVTPDDPEEPEEPEEPETPPPACGTFEITNGFAASSQTLDANGNCVFASPKVGSRAIGFDYTTAEAFCASTMNGGGRIAMITKDGSPATRSIRGTGTQMISSSFQMPGISEITCSTAISPCNNSEFQDGASCLPQTNLSCGRLKNDSLHYLPAGPEVEMASIGVCTFQIPQVTISDNGVSLMGEGQTMQKWVSTLKSAGYNDFDAFISAYSLSATTGVDYAHWKANSNVPTIPRIAYKSVDYITVADTGYGSPATLPGNLVATEIAAGGIDMPLTSTVTIRFTPEATADGESQIADIDLFDIAGNQIDIISSTLKSDSGNTPSTSLIDFNGSTTETFITPSNDSVSRPRAVTLVFSAATRIGSVAFRAAASNAKFPYSFAVYATANASDNTPLFYAGTRQYTQSVKVQGGQWTRILNPVYN